MLRIRFHGRGGQGMKTASRILGSAAHRAGFIVQDSPIYGAERRGAAMAAFTRISTATIRERGAIAQPDLVVVADDTLLADLSSQPLAGCDDRSTVLVNSGRTHDQLRRLAAGPGRWLVGDFTALALEHTSTLASLSTALGVASAHLTGLSLVDSLGGLDDELGGMQLTDAQQAANASLARAAYALGGSWPALEEHPLEATPAEVPLVEVTFRPPRLAAPSVYAAANTPQRRTGNWRQFRPLLDRERCTRCRLCFVLCPDAAIGLDEKEYPVLDYEVCKGCLLCVHECPKEAFVVEKEAR